MKDGTLHQRTPESRKHDKRQKYQTTKQCVEKKHRNDGIVLQRLFLEDIVKAQQSCRKKSER
jgi:hypothetical protein